MRWGTVLLGALGLALLDGLVSSKAGTANAGKALKSAGNAVNWFISPSVPCFSTGTATSTATTTAATASTTPGTPATVPQSTTPTSPRDALSTAPPTFA